MKIIAFVLLLALLFACNENRLESPYAELKMINLSQKFSNKKLQISGMDWYGDSLFFLNQIPSEFNNRIYFATRKEIQASINGQDSLFLNEFNFQQDGVADQIGKTAEYEGIAFKGDSLYLLIEAEKPMRSFIIQGLKDSSSLTLFPQTLTEIPIQKGLHEIACEALLINENRIYVFYEAYGVNVNNDPEVFCYDLSLNRMQSLAFENIEYRITDATRIQADHSFWILNHFWPGEMELLKPAMELLFPSTFDNNKEGVNRLIQLELKEDRIRIKNDHPLMLPPRHWNWEALTLFDANTFLIVNDEFSAPPNRTGLGYIKIVHHE